MKQNKPIKDTDLSKLELMDWKELETNAENNIRNAYRDIAVGRIMHATAVKMIHDLGGQTNEEINEQARKEAEELTKNNTE